jgi:hypothetical protein
MRNEKLPLDKSLEFKAKEFRRVMPLALTVPLSAVAKTLHEGLSFTLWDAIRENNTAAVVRVLDKVGNDWHANVKELLNEKDEDGLTHLENAVMAYADLEVVQKIVEYGGTRHLERALRWLERKDERTDVPRFMRVPEVHDYLAKAFKILEEGILRSTDM